ncbi:UPF0262 family protein [Lichenihabitans psoromatis]|uniref:UPF0262 family protein n=1 Tax=Lichenihabitans psoromatis TaxID=2528642 RepID=UPI001038525B|nr:UPF0262 family protein [Lichenihabitans psoromatis]
MDQSDPTRCRLMAVDLDDGTIGRGTPDQEHERRIAIFDLVENNRFVLPGHEGGPYRLGIALKGTKLALDIRTEDDAPVVLHMLSLAPFRSLLKDYFFLCERYYSAIRTATPSQIEAIDMGRRSLHNEAAELLAQRLQGKIVADFETMRRLFTLVTALHWKG